jgi:serine/threonine protein kinase
MNEREIFQAALDYDEPAQRATYLDQVCAGDAVVRARIEALLASHESASRFLDVPVFEQLHRGDAAATSQLEDVDDNPDDEPAVPPDLSFLGPPTEPGSLGTLGHYHILAPLGQGAFGLVFKAFDARLHRHVAVKIMYPQLAVTSPPRKRFLREAQSAAQIKHENIVQVYDVEEQPLPYLVMEYVEGQTLKEKLDSSGPLDVAEVLHLGRQIASGLAAAHARGLIHRDIKPGNILIEAGAEQKVKITDFGLARAADDATMTRTGVISGTPMYMAPEQAQGVTLDHRADLFSLGSVMYQMACGRPPFRGATALAVLKRVTDEPPHPLQEILADIPDWLCAIIAKLQAKNPDDRFQSGQTVADLLGRCQASLQQNDPVELPADVVPFLPATANSLEPEIVAARNGRLPRRSGVAVAGCVLLVLAVVLAAVIWLTPADGTLTVEVEDPDVSLTIDGEKSYTFSAPGAINYRLKPGEYRVRAEKGQVVREEIVRVPRNGRQVLRFSKVNLPDVSASNGTPVGIAAGAGLESDAIDPRVDPDRRAAEYILGIGGIVQVNNLVDPIKEIAALPEGPLQLTHVYLTYNQKVSDAGLAAFEGCKHLRCLALSATPIGDAGLAHFQASRGLELLHLHSDLITDAGLRHFHGFDQIRNLKVSSPRVTDAGLANFAKCKGLTWLDFIQTPVTDAGLVQFADCQNLQVLALGETKVTDEGLAFFKHCRDLERVHLFHTRITDRGLESLVGLKQLTIVHLKESKVTSEGVRKLAAALPDCKIEWDGSEIDPKAEAE